MLLKLNYIRVTVCYKSLLYHVTKLLKITYSIWCAINHTIKYIHLLLTNICLNGFKSNIDWQNLKKKTHTHIEKNASNCFGLLIEENQILRKRLSHIGINLRLENTRVSKFSNSNGTIITKIRERSENVTNENGTTHDKRESYFLKYCAAWEAVGALPTVSTEGALINCQDPWYT